jgi:hypothetical protein
MGLWLSTHLQTRGNRHPSASSEWLRHSRLHYLLVVYCYEWTCRIKFLGGSVTIASGGQFGCF